MVTIFYDILKFLLIEYIMQSLSSDERFLTSVKTNINRNHRSMNPGIIPMFLKYTLYNHGELGITEK